MTTEEHAPPAEHTEAITRLKDFYAAYGKHLTTVLVVILVALVAGRWYKANKARKTAEASALFATAQAVEDLESLAEKYRKAPSAPLARLRLAKAYYDAGNYDQAIATYEALLAGHRDDTMLGPAAELGLAHCLEAQGLSEAAREKFEAFLIAHPDHFLYVQALFGKARTLDQLGRTADAKAAIEDFIAANPASRWLAPAEEMQESFSARLKAARTPEAPGTDATLRTPPNVLVVPEPEAPTPVATDAADEPGISVKD